MVRAAVRKELITYNFRTALSTLSKEARLATLSRAIYSSLESRVLPRTSGSYRVANGNGFVTRKTYRANPPGSMSTMDFTPAVILSFLYCNKGKFRSLPGIFFPSCSVISYRVSIDLFLGVTVDTIDYRFASRGVKPGKAHTRG